MNSIFVQMAAYRDPQLIPTLLDMLKNSDAPENLHVGVCWQHGDEVTSELFLEAGFDILGYTEDDRVDGNVVLNMTKDGAKFSVIDIHFHKTRGACWARHSIQQLYSGEKYTLQLDSHHRFVEHWDTVLIEMLESLRAESPKPLLTAYVPSFDPDNDPAARQQQPWKMDFDRFIPEGAVFFIPSTIDDWEQREKPMRARFYSAHFAFADGTFATEVQHDPEYFFHGEEISIAARAYTHGYDLYHPHRLVCWHEYTRKGRIKVWDDHTTGQKNKGRVELDWVERNNLCHKRNRILFGMDGEDPTQIDFGKYGFGTERTLRQYEEYAGMSFQYRGVQQATLDRVEPPVLMSYTTEEEWKNTITRSNDVRICIHRNELGELLDDYDFWYVGAHDENYEEIFRKDAQANEIQQYIKNEWIDYRLIFLSNKKPKSYTVWPHSVSRGWLDRIVKDVHDH